MTTTKMFSADEVLEGDEISAEPWKWGSVRSYVFADESGSHWLGELTFHRDDGLQDRDDEVECTLVHEVEKTIKVWEPVE